MTNTQKQCLLAVLKDTEGKPYYEGQIDGKWGKKSQEAAERFLGDFQGGDAQEPDAAASLWEGIRFFSSQEVKCKCGGKYCDGFPVQPNRTLLELADDVRDCFDAPMIPTSVIRCENHNTAVGGVSGSRHKLGKAMDFYIPGFTSSQILLVVKRDKRVRYAYAIDDKCVHMDVE